MSNTESYKVCGLWDQLTEMGSSEHSAFPWPVYRKGKGHYLGRVDESGNIAEFTTIDEFIDIAPNGIFVEFESNVERTVGDKCLFGFHFDKKVFVGEKEEIIEIINENQEEIREKAMTGKGTYSYIEMLMFAKQYEECKNFYRHLIGKAKTEDERKTIGFSLNSMNIERAYDSELLSLNKSDMHVYSLDLGNVQKRLQKRYIEPKYIKELQENHPEFFKR